MSKRPKGPSEHEAYFRLQLRAHKIDGFEEQYRFLPTRLWKFDFAQPDNKIAVELDGGIWGKKSGHNSGIGILQKMEKMNEAQRLGWRVFSFSGDQVKNGEAIQYLLDILNT